jgi:hypothetical protein
MWSKERKEERKKEIKKEKSKAIPSHGGLEGCEILKIPHCLDNWVINDDHVVSLMRWPLLYLFLLEAE